MDAAHASASGQAPTAEHAMPTSFGEMSTQDRVKKWLASTNAPNVDSLTLRQRHELCRFLDCDAKSQAMALDFYLDSVRDSDSTVAQLYEKARASYADLSSWTNCARQWIALELLNGTVDARKASSILDCVFSRRPDLQKKASPGTPQMLNLVLAEKTFARELQAKSAVKEFVEHLDSLAEKWDGSNYYVASTSLVQSSGFGKSRTATAAAEYGAYVLYLNFVHGDAFAYPRPTPLGVTNFFMDCDSHKKALAPVAERKPGALLLILLHSAVVARSLGVPPTDHRELQVMTASGNDAADAFFKLVAKFADQLYSLCTWNEISVVNMYLLARLIFGLDKTMASASNSLFHVHEPQSSPDSPASPLSGKNMTALDELFANATEAFTKFYHVRGLVPSLSRATTCKWSCEHLKYLFVFDEARTLLKDDCIHYIVARRCLVAIALALGDRVARGIFSIFLDTTSTVSSFSPMAVAEWSSRAKSSIIFDPLFELNLFDALAKCWAEHTGPLLVRQVFHPSHSFCYGRPLWGMAAESPSKCFLLATQKLLFMKSAEEMVENGAVTTHDAIAVLRQRIPFKVIDVELARDLVATRMAICTAISEDRSRIEASAASETVLAEAAAHLLDHPARRALTVSKFVSVSLSGSRIDVGFAGELMACLLWAFAHDAAAKSMFKGVSRQEPMGAPPSSWPKFLDYAPISHFLSNANRTAAYYSAPVSVASLLTGLFGDAHVNRIRATLGNQPRVTALLDQGLASFTHWVKVDYQVQPHHLVVLFMRSAAILCKTNEKGVDLIIPVVMPNDQGEHELKPSAMTFILVQVKNYAKHASSARALTARKRSARLDALECGISWFSTLPYLSVYMAVRNLESGKSTFEVYSTPPRTSSPTADDLCHDVLVEMRGTDTKGQPINAVVGGDDQGVMSLSADQKRVVHDVHQALFGSTADAELATALSTTPGLGVGLSADGGHSDPSMDHGHDDLATSSESSTNRAASWSDTGLRIYSMLQFTHLAVADNKSASYDPFVGALRAVVRTYQQVAIAAVGLNGDLYAELDAKKRTEDVLPVSVLHTALQDFLKGEPESKKYSDKTANMVIPLVEKAFDLVISRQLPPSMLPNELRPRPRDDKDGNRDEEEVGETAEGQREKDKDGDVVMTDL
ncbi:hypothetical protein AMAG_08711 [Allomyces macrogynus ATCC 38327]|uniref:Uncharacterized protein n=1 Tax=Allomyces macrogynus (strain ATCC 38327) TaxID=578462 RepID=A0A0L0SM58_ALLM3|nr:hypothetical protein AMAG_08711 [Allomyces macrogynus ATCC 38327]|eukprot:KNE63607.1 hypothetical protein AMAG_08711 [Allomyces macrogynus ATCC 38327]